MSNFILKKKENVKSRFFRRGKHTMVFTILVVLSFTGLAQDTWMKKSDFGGTPRYGATGFSIGDKGYIGTGFDQNQTYRKDFWRYNPDNNAWTQVADFAGGERYDATGFSIGNKGYVGTGFGNGTYYNDFWEYNSSTNTWTQKASFGGNPRRAATGFSIGKKGYIGTGIDENFNYKKDFWEYRPASDTWTQKADFGGTARWGAAGLSIGKQGYIGTGLDFNFIHQKDFWQYKPNANTWVQKADFGGTARLAAVGFNIGDKGYIGTGHTSQTYQKDFWEYDPVVNGWVQKSDLAGTARDEAVGFSIGNKGYVGTGFRFITTSIYLKDFWEYTPDGILLSLKGPAGQSTTANNVQVEVTTLTPRLGDEQIVISEIYPNPVQNKLMIKTSVPAGQFTIQVYDLHGKMIDLPINLENSEAQINTSDLPGGYYLLEITNKATGSNEVHRFVKQNNLGIKIRTF